MNSIAMNAPEFRTTIFNFVNETTISLEFSSMKTVFVVGHYQESYNQIQDVNIIGTNRMVPLFSFTRVVKMSVKSKLIESCQFDYCVHVTQEVGIIRSQSVGSFHKTHGHSGEVDKYHISKYFWKRSSFRRRHGDEQSERKVVDESEIVKQITKLQIPIAISNNALLGGFVPDEPTVNNLFEREYYWDTFTIDMNVDTNTRVFHLTLPCDLLRNKFPFYGVLGSHTIVRTDVRMLIKLNVTPFHSGSLMMICYPSNYDYVLCPQDCLLLPHRMLNIGFEKAGSLLVEHVTPLKYLDVRSRIDVRNQDFGIYVWNRIDAGSSAQRLVCCSVFFKFENTILAIKRPFKGLEQMAWIFDKSFEALADLSQDVGASIEQETFWGKVSSFGSAMLKYFGKVGNVVSDVGQLLGLFDSPMEFVNEQNENTTVDVPQKCLSFRVISSDVMSKSRFRSFDLKAYIQTPGRVAVASWKPSYTPGTSLMSLPLDLNVFTIQRDVKQTIPLCEAARNFEYWRGDIIWTIEVIATRFHQGQLLAGWSPGTSLALGTNDDLRQVYFESFEIGEQNTFSIECPFVCESEWRLTNQHIRGNLLVNVQNPLLCPETVGQVVAVNVYLSASENFWFACPRNERYAFAQSLWRPIKEITRPPQYMSQHTDIRVLLRRANTLYHTNVSLRPDTWCLVAILPVVDKTAIPFNTYMRRGSGRWSCTSTVTKQMSVIMLSRCMFASERQNVHFPNLDFINPLMALRGGSVFHSPNTEPTFRIEVPHYLMMDNVFNDVGIQPIEATNHQPLIELYAFASVSTTFDLFLRWEAGDDFSIMYPLPGIPRGYSTRSIIPVMSGNRMPKPFDISDNKSSADAYRLWTPSGLWNTGTNDGWNQIILNDNYLLSGFSVKCSVASGDLNVRFWYKNHFDWNNWAQIEVVQPNASGYCAKYLDSPVLCRGVKIEVFSTVGDVARELSNASLFGHALEHSQTIMGLVRSIGGEEQGLFGAFNAMSALGTLWDSVTEFGKNLKNELPGSENPFYNLIELLLVHFLAIGNSLHSFLNGGSAVSCIACITSCTFFIVRKFENARDCSKKVNVFKKWLGIEQSGYIGDVVKLLTGLFGLVAGIFRFSVPAEFYTYVELTSDGNDTILHRFVCFVKYFFLGKKIFEDMRVGVTRDVLAFLEDMRFKERNRCLTMNSVRANGMEHILSQRAKAVALEEIAYRVKLPLPLIRELRDYILLIDGLTQVTSEPKSQPEPVGIFLYGKPGVGKSFLASHYLSKHVLLDLGYAVESNVDEMVYNMPVTKQRYMDGYNQQPWVSVDEFLQSVDCEDALQVINLISTTSNPVNMAELKEKKMLFSSPIVCCCSNAASFQCVRGIQDTQALVRRFPIAYEIRIKKEYSLNGKLDAKRVVDVMKDKDLNGEKKVLDDVFEFVPKKMLQMTRPTESGEGVWRTYSEVVNEISQLTTERRRTFNVARGASQLSKPKHQKGFKYFAELCQLFPQIEVEYPAVRDCVGDKYDARKIVMCNLPMFAHTPVIKFGKRQMCVDKVDVTDSVLGLRVEYSKDANISCDRETLIDDIAEFIMERITYHELVHFGTTCPHFLPDEWYRMVKDEPWEGITVPFWKRYLNFADSHPIINFLASFMVGFSVVFLGTLAYEACTNNVNSKIEKGESFETVVKKKVRYEPQAYNGRVKVTKLPRFVATEQDGWTNTNKERDQVNRIRLNLVSVCARAYDGNGLLEPFAIEMHGLFVDSRTLLVNEHFFREYQKLPNRKKVVIITSFDSNGDVILERRIPFEELNSRCVQKSMHDVDVRVVNVPDFPGMKNIRHFFSSDVPKLGSMATLLEGHNKQPCVSGKIGDVSLCETANGRWLSLDLHPKDNLTVSGDCGRPWVIVHKSEVSIVGIHASIYDDQVLGIACVPLECFGNDQHIEDALQLKSGECQLFGVNCVNQIAQKSDYIKTDYVFHDVEWLPSAKGHKIMIQNAAKYHERGTIDPKQIVVTQVKSYWTKFVIERQCRTFDVHKALNGSEIMRSIVLKTSSGYLKFGGYRDGKTDLLERDSSGQLVFSDYAKTFVSPLTGHTFVDHLAICDDMVRKRQCFPMIWVSALKDELCTPEKFVKGKTRVIEQPGLDYLILVRMYFGDFLDWFKSHRGIKFKHAIGIDKEIAWADIACELLRHSDVGLALDYSQWDGSVPPWCFEIFAHFVDEYYDTNVEDQNARATLLHMLRCANVLVGDCVRVTDRGNKSGNPFTDVFNSVCNASVVMVSYLYLRSWYGNGLDVFAFDRDVAMITYGDDMICAIKRECLKYFNGPEIARVLFEFGFVVTDSSKSVNSLAKCVPILSPSFTFLKTPFVYDDADRVWLAPLPIDVILRELCWIPKGVYGNAEDKFQRVNNIVHFLCHHPIEVYTSVVCCMRSQGLRVPYDWRTLRDELIMKQREGVSGHFI